MRQKRKRVFSRKMDQNFQNFPGSPLEFFQQFYQLLVSMRYENPDNFSF